MVWSAATCSLEAKKKRGYRRYNNSGYLEHLTCTGPKRFYTIFHVRVFKIGCIRHMHTCLHSCMRACTDTHTHGYACRHTRTDACMHTRMHTCMLAHAHTHAHTRMHACTHTHTRTLIMICMHSHTCMRTCTHTHTHRVVYQGSVNEHSHSWQLVSSWNVRAKANCLLGRCLCVSCGSVA